MLTSDWKSIIILTISITLLMIVTKAWTGENYKFPLAPHIPITAENGKPDNDFSKFGLQGRYRTIPDLDLDYTDYYFERSYRLLKLNSANEIDGKELGIIVDVGEERDFTLNDQLKPYVAGTIGVMFINADAFVKLTRGWQLFY